MNMVMSKSRFGIKLLGIDVSHHNGKIDWSKVKKAGVSFAFLKASEGATLGDSQFAFNLAQARALSIPCGAYHFFIPTTNVADQVTNFCNQVRSLQNGDLPPVLDAEVPSRWFNAPTEAKFAMEAWLKMTVDQRVDKIIEWTDGVEKKLGVTPFLYASPSFIRDILGNSPRLKKLPLWIAHYGVASPTIPAPYTDWVFWQDSETSTIDGISGKVDRDWFNGSVDDLEGLRKFIPIQTRIASTVRGWCSKFFGWIYG